MTGLDKIVEQIRQEAQATSEDQLAKAKIEADEILADAKRNREASYAVAMEQIETEMKQLLQRGQSVANLQERKLLLNAKQQMIHQIFEEALSTMRQLPIRDYFELLLRMVDRYGMKKKGCIQLSKQDMDRIPDFFRQELEERQIVISKQPIQINGGFILTYGEIEQNCSFESLLAANRENLQDEIVRMIF